MWHRNAFLIQIKKKASYKKKKKINMLAKKPNLWIRLKIGGEKNFPKWTKPYKNCNCFKEPLTCCSATFGHFSKRHFIWRSHHMTSGEITNPCADIKRITTVCVRLGHHMMFWLFNRRIPIRWINKKTGKNERRYICAIFVDHFVLYGQSLQHTGKCGCYEDCHCKTSLCILCFIQPEV